MERTALRRPLGSPTPASSTVSDSKIILVHVGLQARKIGDGEINRPNLSLSLINRASGPPGLRASNVRPVSPCPRAPARLRRALPPWSTGQLCILSLTFAPLHAAPPHLHLCTVSLPPLPPCQLALSRKRCLGGRQDAMQFRLLHPQTPFRELRGKAAPSFECT
jgi:hypothetical protein